MTIPEFSAECSLGPDAEKYGTTGAFNRSCLSQISIQQFETKNYAFKYSFTKPSLVSYWIYWTRTNGF